MTIDSPIHAVTLSWDDGDITWLTAPSGTPMTTAYSTNIYNGDPDWELCYIVALPALDYFETTRNTYTDAYSGTACGALFTGVFSRLQYQSFTTGGNVPYATIHRNIVSSTYKLSIYTFIDVASNSVPPTGATGWTLFRNGVSQSTNTWTNTATLYAPRYSGWKNFTIATCADIYDTFAIPANAPALFSQPYPATLTTTLSGSICSGILPGVSFTDVGWRSPSGAGNNGFVYRSPSNIAAPDIEITFTECPP